MNTISRKGGGPVTRRKELVKKRIIELLRQNSVASLKTQLRDKSLSTEGRKEDLVERLANHFSPTHHLLL